MHVLKRGVDKYISSNIQLNISILFLSLILFIVAAALFLSNDLPGSTVGIIMLPLTYALGVYAYQRHILWGSGAVGEGAVARELEKLGDSYYLINGVVVPPNRGDTDHIIVGPNGLFVVESKNYGGEVECDSDSWIRYKTSRRGKRYNISVGSPSRQVKRNAKVLKDFILKHDGEIFHRRTPHIWVQSILVFTNKNIRLSLKNPTVEVLKIGELADYIQNKASELSLTDGEAEKIGEVILKHSK
ncbi:MAG: NERD domain-containing protein [Candidatus Altiarchaeota archaeon]|nr:NERD domain-containing protein [Candidatus Altiarchaeota archaeon]